MNKLYGAEEGETSGPGIRDGNFTGSVKESLYGR